ncbi:MAG: FAD-binding protein, partial [ANME-2 cluster archaeon]|nr:FAD-binding protein [ANME-2 cluster archaeon]
GRGIDGYVHLDLRHLGKELIMTRLSQIHDIVLSFSGIDCTVDPIPIQPTAHYSMGGIPTDVNGRVPGISGLFAAGECACVSVHGANRLGGNSMLETIVFGRRAGIKAAEYVKKTALQPMPADALPLIEQEINLMINSKGEENAADIRAQLQSNMTLKCGIFRDMDGLTQMLQLIITLKERFNNIGFRDRGMTFNTELIEALELKNILDFSQIIVAGALAREESRGAHSRTDFLNRDDEHWMKHTLAYTGGQGPVLDYKPVAITRYTPQRRAY